MGASVLGIHLTGNHASRPTSGLAYGTLYSCTTHGLIYRTSDDGATWATYFDPSTAGGGSYQPLDADLTAIAGLTSAADKVPYFTGSGTAAVATFTSTARSLVDDTSTSAMATTLGLGTGDSPQFAAVEVGNASDTTLARASAGVLQVEGNRIFAVGGADVPVADGGTGSSTAAAARTALGVAWEMISDTTLGSDTANFDLTSIPGTYKHLMIEYQMRSDRGGGNTGDAFKMLFNNDTSTIYSYSTAQHDGSATFYAQNASAGAFLQVAEVSAASAPAGASGSGTIWIPNYAGTTWDKNYQCSATCILNTTAGNQRVWTTGGVWASTAAITRVTLAPVNGSNFKTGSRVTLYGLS